MVTATALLATIPPKIRLLLSLLATSSCENSVGGTSYIMTN